MSAPEPRSFEPKTPVSLNPPKDDPISVEQLATADGKLSSSPSCWLAAAAVVVSFLCGFLHRLASQLVVVVGVCPLCCCVYGRLTGETHTGSDPKKVWVAIKVSRSIRSHRARRAGLIGSLRTGRGLRRFRQQELRPRRILQWYVSGMPTPSCQPPLRPRLRCSRLNSVCRQGRIPRVREVLGEGGGCRAGVVRPGPQRAEVAGGLVAAIPSRASPISQPPRR